MLKRLHIQNCFTHQDRVIDFDQGLTAITGPNESGKSLILEMIRYALFGTKALRGQAPDYKKLKVELDFTASGRDLRVVRNGSKTELYEGNEKLAVGTKPVNSKIVEILGYDLTVFDVANNCQQGEVEALSALRPAERKAMVDQTIGLTIIDDLVAELGEELAGERRAVEVMESSLFEPVEPDKPANYQPTEVLAASREQVAEKVAELNQLRGWLSNAGPSEPVKPTCRVTETSAALAEHQRRRQALLLRLQEVKAKLATTPVPEKSETEIQELEQQLEAFRRWQEAEHRRSLAVKPQYTVAEVEQFAKDWELLALYDQLDSRRCDLDLVINQTTVECPECHHHFSLDQERIERLRKAVDEIEQLIAGRPRPEIPPIQVNETVIEDVQQEWQVYELTLAGLEAYKDVEPVEDPGIVESDIDEWCRQNERAKERPNLEMRCRDLEGQLERLPDRSADLEARKRYEWELETYETRKAEYEAWLQEKQKVEKRVAELAGVEEQLVDLDQKLAASRAYEAAVEVYHKQLAEYQQGLERLDAAKKQVEVLKKAREALKVLKVRVKQHLLPSLNRVASLLLAQMTGGERTDITIDDDFNITVDGQPINTLSGSGKAVANLAIRIGLGQVLTNRVFSVFMGDEIDASMDSNRAGFTAECMQNLTQHIKQVLLVSHKQHEADHYVELGR